MADPKKPDKKDAKPAPKKDDPFVEIMSMLIGLLVIVYLVNGFLGMLTSSGVFSKGLSGLSAQNIILSHTRPINSLQNPLGVTVVSTGETSVYDSAGGNKIGSQPLGSKGKIIQGPVEINGDKYWYVDYDSGTDGWVKESDIGYLESNPTFFERMLLSFYKYSFSLKIFSILISLVLIFFTAYIVIKLTEVRNNTHALIYPTLIKEENVVNPKWQMILNHIDSLNPSDWRLAILEADIMLDEILDKLQLPGDTMGDKLKAVEKSDFNTLDNAWEAHRIRNQIAHEGQDFILTEHEAKRVISLYQSVFEEFAII